eukprot:m.238912 g.238912  ORF g.238912 m.238912 type:complete len:207 (-) comp54363_c2_seq14:209-829(-)
MATKSPTKEGQVEYRLVVVGAGAVGKSAITVQFIQSLYQNYYDPTIEDLYRKHCTIDGEQSLLHILDTAGQEEYSTMREQYMRNADGLILVFSVTDRKSFDEVESFQKLALRVKDKSKFPMVVVGNKSDLVSERVISTTEASALAEKIGCPYIETSAKEARNIEEVFFEMVRVIRWFKNPSAGESYAPVSARGKKGGKDKGCCIVM